jgi:hypothetical protein
MSRHDIPNGRDTLSCRSDELANLRSNQYRSVECALVLVGNEPIIISRTPMKLPNRGRAIIAKEKLTECLLNVEHRRGASKARLLRQFGCSKENWERLERDIRTYHLEAEIDRIRQTEYGVRYGMPLNF